MDPVVKKTLLLRYSLRCLSSSLTYIFDLIDSLMKNPAKAKIIMLLELNPIRVVLIDTIDSPNSPLSFHSRHYLQGILEPDIL